MNNGAANASSGRKEKQTPAKEADPALPPVVGYLLSSAMKTPAETLSLEAQNAARREENRQLRASQVVAQAQQVHSDKEELRQVRFRSRSRYGTCRW